MLVLSVLHFLGCGWTLDDLEEVTMINPETLCLFLHKFLEYGSTTMYNKYVTQPLSTDELHNCAHKFAQAGLPGALGSTDATHIVIKKCFYRLR